MSFTPVAPVTMIVADVYIVTDICKDKKNIYSVWNTKDEALDHAFTLAKNYSTDSDNIDQNDTGDYQNKNTEKYWNISISIGKHHTKITKKVSRGPYFSAELWD